MGGAVGTGGVSKTDEFCINDEDICTKNEEFCIKTRNFADSRSSTRCCRRACSVIDLSSLYFGVSVTFWSILEHFRVIFSAFGRLWFYFGFTLD